MVQYKKEANEGEEEPHVTRTRGRAVIEQDLSKVGRLLKEYGIRVITCPRKAQEVALDILRDHRSLLGKNALTDSLIIASGLVLRACLVTRDRRWSEVMQKRQQKGLSAVKVISPVNLIQGGKALILLIGEQPVPNLLATRHLRPDMAALVHTKRTERIAERLRSVLEQKGVRCLSCRVDDPYNLPAIRDALQQFIQTNLQGHEIVFNLTGGTKIMSLAAFLVASQLDAPVVYFQTEGGHSLLYHYQFTGQKDVRLEKQEEIAGSITLDDYLRAQVGEYTKEPPRNEFEQQVYQALQVIPDLEILTSVRLQGALEVDFVVRLGNQVGVIEAKTKGAKSGIDQIQAVAEQRYLGTYVAKFLVSGHPVDRNNKNLAKAYRIEVIEVPSYAVTGSLSKADQEELRQRIQERLQGG